ncbi:MAG: hypothetical protein M1823_000037 [Watsoniomyces obsoletus]|nr:MAG: hypothetical protein M1823_000037 [Watsoniomyces obsoletus]
MTEIIELIDDDDVTLTADNPTPKPKPESESDDDSADRELAHIKALIELTKERQAKKQAQRQRAERDLAAAHAKKNRADRKELKLLENQLAKASARRPSIATSQVGRRGATSKNGQKFGSVRLANADANLTSSAPITGSGAAGVMTTTTLARTPIAQDHGTAAKRALATSDTINAPQQDKNRKRQHQAINSSSIRIKREDSTDDMNSAEALLKAFQTKSTSATSTPFDGDGSRRVSSAASVSMPQDDTSMVVHGKNKRARKNKRRQGPTDEQGISEVTASMSRLDSPSRPNTRDEWTADNMDIDPSTSEPSTPWGITAGARGHDVGLVVVKREPEEEVDADTRMESLSVLRQYPTLPPVRGKRRIKIENDELVTWPARMPPYINQLPDISLKQEFPGTNYKFSRDFLTTWIGGNPNITHVIIGTAKRQNQLYPIEEYDCWSPIWNPHIPPRRGVNGAALSVDTWDGDPIRQLRRDRGRLADGSHANEEDLLQPRHTFCKRRELEYDYVGMYSQGRHIERLTPEEHRTQIPEKTRKNWISNLLVKAWGKELLVAAGIANSKEEVDNLVPEDLEVYFSRPDDDPGQKLRFFWRYMQFVSFDHDFYETLAAKGREIGWTTKPSNPEHCLFGHETSLERAERVASGSTNTGQASTGSSRTRSIQQPTFEIKTTDNEGVGLHGTGGFGDEGDDSGLYDGN